MIFVDKTAVDKILDMVKDYGGARAEQARLFHGAADLREWYAARRHADSLFESIKYTLESHARAASGDVIELPEPAAKHLTHPFMVDTTPDPTPPLRIFRD